MYNTLGNFVVNPQAGLAIVDFARSTIWQAVGTPTIKWQLDDPTNETGGTKRYWDLEIKEVRETSLPISFEAELIDYSPHNP